jgi:hypothetical protein
MSSRTALAALLVSIALVVAIAPVALAPVADRALADMPSGADPGAGTASSAPASPGAATTTAPAPSPGAATASPGIALLPPSTPPPSAAGAVGGDAPTTPPAEPSGRRAFRSPIGGSNGRTVRLDLAAPRDYVAQTNLVQCVGASIQMMLNMIKPGADRSAAFQHRLQVQARRRSGPTPPGFVRNGASIWGWEATLELRGGGDYAIVGADNLRQAMRIAARAIHDEGRPVGLLVWRGRHAWVMSGYEAVVDRKAPGGFVVTRATILDPLHPYGGSGWGPSPKPGSAISVTAVGRQFVRRQPRPDSPWTVFWRSIPGNRSLEGKYVLVVPVDDDGEAG